MDKEKVRFERMRSGDTSRFLELYETSFPEEERRNYAGVSGFARFASEKGRLFNVLGAYDEEERLVGFLTYWKLPGYTYVEHFAIAPSLRGEGIGGRMMRHLIEIEGGDILLEVEPPEDEMKKRRVEFYERLGFVAHREVEYMQPSYGPGQPEVRLMLMTHGDVALSEGSLAPMLREVYNFKERSRNQ